MICVQMRSRHGPTLLAESSDKGAINLLKAMLSNLSTASRCVGRALNFSVFA
jgi:hypothetical protein